MTAQKVTITLKDAEDWLEWIEVVKSTAIGLDIWECIDPEKSRDQLRVVSKPEWPTLSTVKAGATGIKDLDENEKFQYKLLQKRYERDISEYETSKKGLGIIRIEIQKSVSRPNLQYTFRKDTPYDMLVRVSTSTCSEQYGTRTYWCRRCSTNLRVVPGSAVQRQS
jgi:hypothetical protein